MDPSTQELIDHFRRKFPMSDLMIRYDAGRNEWMVHAMSPGYVIWLDNFEATTSSAHYMMWHPSLKTALMDVCTEYAKRIRR